MARPFLPENLCIDLNVSARIFQDEIELFDYAERVPIVRRWNIDHLQDPLIDGGLLYSLRKEVLPHPAIFYRDVAQREMYLYDNNPFFYWFTDNIMGSVPPPETDASGRIIHDNCAACGSTFFGFPLKKHRYQDCGFVNLIPNQFALELLVANHHAFCGYCNAKSTHHYMDRCGNPQPCVNCRVEGHKFYHKVCGEAWGASPAAFKNRVQELRILRLSKIQYGISQGLYGIPLPTDTVPRSIASRHRRNEEIRGCGPLINEAALTFRHIPDQSYRWKRYRGLASVEADIENIVRPRVLSNNDQHWFMRLEHAAREIQQRFHNHGRPRHILDQCYHLPLARYPPEIHAPGRDPLIEDVPVMAPPMAPVPPPPAPVEQVHQEVQVDAAGIDEVEADANQDASDLSYSSEDAGLASEAEIAEIDEMASRKVAFEDDALRTFFPDNGTKSSFTDCFKKIVKDHESGPDGTPPRIIKDGKQIRNVDFHLETQIQLCIMEEMEQWIVREDQEVYTFGTPAEVVEHLASLPDPESMNSLAERIDTWLVVLSGTRHSDRLWAQKESFNDLHEYYAFLKSLASSISKAARCFKKLDPSRFEGHIVQTVPSYHSFLIEDIRQEVEEWKLLDGDEFVLYLVDTIVYPFCMAVDQQGDDTITSDQEIQFEKQLKRVIRAKEGTHEESCYKIPPLDVIEALLNIDPPRQHMPLVRRICLVQDSIVGYHENSSDIAKVPMEVLRQYVVFWRATLQAIREMYTKKKNSRVRLSDCLKEIVKGSQSSVELVLPSVTAFLEGTLGFWLSWICKVFVPTIQRILQLDCECDDHSWSSYPKADDKQQRL